MIRKSGVQIMGEKSLSGTKTAMPMAVFVFRYSLTFLKVFFSIRLVR